MPVDERDLSPIYPDERPSFTLAAFLNRWGFFATLMVLAATGLALVGSRSLMVDQARDNELVFAALVSLAPDDTIESLVVASDRRAIVISEHGTSVLPADASGDNRHLRWRDRVRNAAQSSDDRQFTSTDPDGENWWHTVISPDESTTLVISRPAHDALAPWREVALAIVGLGVAAITSLGALILLANRRIARPTRMLADAGDDLRVRGEVRRDVRQQLNEIGDSPAELRRLVETFEEMEADARQGRGQVQGLLNAGLGLGSSLDQQTVLDRTLEHLEQLLGAERSAILRYDQRIEAFELVAVRGHNEAYVADLRARGHDPTMPSIRALRERIPIQVSDTKAEVVSPELRRRSQRHGYRSILAVPLTNELDQPTVLLLHAKEPRTYSFDEVELSKSFASIAGAALRNAELFSSTDARLMAQTTRLEAIIGSVDQGLLVESDEGRLLFANPIMRNLVPGISFVDGMATSEFLDAVLASCPQPAQTRAKLDTLEAGGPAHCDVTLSGPRGEADRVYRVRTFDVRYAKGPGIGRGQTWLDISHDRQLEQMKSGLLAAVSHEFRTPLTLIKGYASTLLADDVSWNPADKREFLQLVSSEADRLSDLVQRILDMRRIDAGMVSLRRSSTGLDVVLNTVLDAMPHEADRIQVEPLPPLTLDIDTARIVTVLRNLVENGCRYSPADRPVVVSAAAAGGVLTLSVRDHGPGIPAGQRDEVFQTFVRGDLSLDAEHGGIGLGLAIAKGFVEAHGGRIWITEPDDGSPGSVFSFTLPLGDHELVGAKR